MLRTGELCEGGIVWYSEVVCCVRVGQFGIKKWWAVRVWDTVYRNGGQCEGGAF